jgi:branched-chain amino acid transport system substrate-binding protein
MKLKTHFLAATASLALMAGTAWAENIKIGFNVPLTGFAASDGESALNGAKLAIDAANAAGGINGDQLELMVYDDQASPDQAVPLAQKMIESDQVIAAVSGSYSGSTRAAAGIFQEAGVPYISAYAIHPDITRAGNYVFRTSFMGEVQGRAGAKLVGEQLNLHRAVIITLQNDFGQSLSAGFKEKAKDFGVEVIGEYEYAMADRQFGPIISKIRADNPDVIYATGYFFTAGPLVAQLRAAGITTQVIGQEGFDSQSYIDIAGPASEGTIITTSLDRDSSEAATKDFIAAYEAATGHKADMVAASANTAVNVLIEAMRKAGATDRVAIREAIEATDMQASTGHISFNALGEVQKAVQVQVVKDGDWHSAGVIDDAVLLAPPTE